MLSLFKSAHLSCWLKITVNFLSLRRRKKERRNLWGWYLHQRHSFFSRDTHTEKKKKKKKLQQVLLFSFFPMYLLWLMAVWVVFIFASKLLLLAFILTIFFCPVESLLNWLITMTHSVPPSLVSDAETYYFQRILRFYYCVKYKLTIRYNRSDSY